MQTLSVQTTAPYAIQIGPGLLARAGEQLATIHKPCTVAVITDDNVAALYGGTLQTSLKAAGFSPVQYVFAHGEAAKCLEEAQKIYGFLADHGVTRGDLIIALGGGVAGDLAGFAAATWLRGVPFVQIPTTFLAAIDSSVGGKTAVNIPAGKNLVGAFWQPSLVLCDTETLSTLSDDVFCDGVAEAIKYGAIFDEALLMKVADGNVRARLDVVIPRCIDLKRGVVEEDERDTGRRQLLNFGHTLGHAVEKHSAFTVSHGRAVGIGMAELTRRTEALGLTESGTARRIEAALRAYGMQDRWSGDLRALCPAVLGDKKRHGGTVSFVVLDRIGQARLHPVAAHEIERFVCG